MSAPASKSALAAYAADFPSLVSSRSEEHTSELQSQSNLVCRLLLEKKKKKQTTLRPRPKMNTRDEHRDKETNHKVILMRLHSAIDCVVVCRAVKSTIRHR